MTVIQSTVCSDTVASSQAQSPPPLACGVSTSKLVWGAADLAGRIDAISGICAFDRSHGFSSNCECLQILWGNEQRSGTKSLAGLARLFGSVRHSYASPGTDLVSFFLQSCSILCLLL